ncbi:MAG: protein translocase subunit SecF, partial [Actinomycetota bacterium]|nr:protein translocase subunit SecF [Actinomycetota bacterium]
MSLAGRLYRGETNFDLVGNRRRWYIASAILILVCVASFVFRGFNFGIEFAGGNQYLVPATDRATVASVRAAVASTGVTVASAQQVGSGSNRRIQVRTPELKPDQVSTVKDAIAKKVGVDQSNISDDAVSSSWGSDVTRKALTGLLVFLIAVCVYIGFRFEPKMAIAAIAALVHDVIVAAGIYSLVGFEVTPSTVVGLLTILGFSLYDTVVVFDKVAENSKGLLGGSRMTFSEAANLAVNQTFMRSINTSLIALLPVAGLLFVGAGLLGVGTLKDLALVLFVGLASGAYSSLFLATPVLADLKEREPAYAALRQRVIAKRAGAAVAPARRPGRSGSAPAAQRAAVQSPTAT